MSAAVTVIDLPNDHGSRKLGRSRFGSLPSAMRRLSERLHERLSVQADVQVEVDVARQVMSWGREN
jgi:hypothetical protein